jgi:hypothetical protein
MLTIVTVYTLLSEVISGDEMLSPEHLMSVAALMALMVGVHQASVRSWGARFVLVPFCLATVAFILVSAGTRNATLASAKSNDHAAQLNFLKERLATENKVLAQADATKNDACLKPKSNVCKTATAKQQDAERRRDNTQAKILGLGAPDTKTSAYHSLAALLLLPSGSGDLLYALMPYLQVLLCELGAALFVSLGLAKVRPPHAILPPKKRVRKKARRGPPRPSAPPTVVLPFRQGSA